MEYERKAEPIGRELVRRLLPRRDPEGHKGTFGKVLCLCGSVGYTGAPVFASRGAVRSGAGLVFLGVPESIWPVAAVKSDEAMPFPLPEAEGRLSLLAFVARYGNQHASPNSGYPESALAGILDCRFGGPHNYFGEEVWKPYIGSNERPLKTEDMRVAVRINRRVEWWMVVAVIVTSTLASFCF